MDGKKDDDVVQLKKCLCQWLWPPQGWVHLDNCDVAREAKEELEERFAPMPVVVFP